MFKAKTACPNTSFCKNSSSVCFNCEKLWYTIYSTEHFW